MEPTDATPWKYEPVPPSAIRLFRMAWILESWLRLIVYVELRAANLSWDEPIKRHGGGQAWPPKSQTRDKSLTHMVTSHENVLSYVTFGELINVIFDKSEWHLFEAYFPPQHIMQAKIEEIKAIRNRIAHFREPHAKDEARFRLLFDDVAPGLHKFCARYRRAVVSPKDPVAARIVDLWAQVGYGYEMLCPGNDWIYASGVHRMNPLMHATLNVSIPRRQTATSDDGLIYRLSVSPARDGKFNISNFLEATAELHNELIHFIIESEREVSVTIPGIHGPDKVAELVGIFLRAGIDSARTYRSSSLDEIRVDWPETVL
ncbi:MAG: hypothetical protein IT428_22830, partial [Planctomycetaceae bacterium]|nr:hypothetical protein [Planctomycetaceae bacterium]